MKIARFVLKVVGFCLALAAAACCVIAYWDKITECVHRVGSKLGLSCCSSDYADFDDYADWED
ncbi:hypothetical protein [Vermiculatibacterium agrestimuris]|uniref:hypothetical protein n=1 Tax=Vermiculatibacterium agrestimuris TaxID=2941519 RepID=UPI0020425DA7|nr:hypothetical protein [Vermiculatibacterium agrestimuris]